MLHRNYRVVLHTEIGERIGKLRVSVSEGKLKGILYLLGKETECTGEVDEKGNCKLVGTLNTLKNKIQFVATGHLRTSDLLLTLKYKTRSYLLKGRPIEG